MRKFLPLLVIFALCAPASLRAQELKLQPTPFTAFLDFRALSQSRTAAHSFPIWLEAFEMEAQKATAEKAETTTFRLRFRKFAGLSDEIMLRVFFDDTQRPIVTAWSEIGHRVLPPRELGLGLGLATSETILLAMAGVDYVDIEVKGDGSNVRGAFISSVQQGLIRSLLDFAPTTLFNDPFQSSPSAQTGSDDALLYGRVKATLEAGSVKLSPENGGAAEFNFDLATTPQIALLTFEILNADVANPAQISANANDLGAAAMTLPDLADPAYQGAATPLRADTVFHYAGWIKCQKVLPASLLQSGSNSVTVQSSAGTEPVAVRAVEVQLKYENR